MFLEHKHLYMTKGMVPEGDYEIEFGKAEVMTEGKDVTIISWSHMLLKAMEAAQTLADDNISAEVINLRTLSPLDTDTIMASVAKTNRVVIAQEAVRRGGVGSDIASYIQAEEFYSLDAPIEIVAGLNIPIPFNLNLEKASVPQSADIVAAAMRTLEHA